MNKKNILKDHKISLNEWKNILNEQKNFGRNAKIVKMNHNII